MSLSKVCGPVGDHAHYLGLGRYVAVDAGNTFHFLHFAAGPEGDHLETKRIARHNRPPKTGVLDPAKERYLLVPVLKFAKRENRANLGQSLDLQNSRHYGRPRKMSCEKVFVRSYLLDPDNAGARLELDYLVDIKERISMRKYLLDRDAVINGAVIGHKIKKSGASRRKTPTDH